MSSTTKDSTNNNALGLSSPALTYTIRIAAIVFIAEALVMLFLAVVPIENAFFNGLFDSIALTLILTPLFYKLVYLPIITEVKLRRNLQKELEETNVKLEAYASIAEEQIKHKIDRLAGLRYIDMAITASLDLRVTLNVILEQVSATLHVDAADILLLNPNTLRLEHAASRGFRTKVLQHSHLRLGEGHAGRAALEARTVSIENLQKDAGDLLRAPLLSEEDFITFCCAPLISRGNIKGVIEIFHRTKLDINQELLDFVEALASQAAIAVDNASMFNDLHRANTELSLAYETTLEGWSRALDLRDKETEGHSRRVTETTVRLARDMGMSEEELKNVRRGALLHDIGKMGVPDHILLKPGPLTEEEWKVMRMHPVYARDLLLPITYLKSALDIPYCHHEKWDGTGYPRGLKGEEIPLPARIFALVDVCDALQSDRPYRSGWPKEQVIEHIKSLSGNHFDPEVVKAFLKSEMHYQVS